MSQEIFIQNEPLTLEDCYERGLCTKSLGKNDFRWQPYVDVEFEGIRVRSPNGINYCIPCALMAKTRESPKLESCSEIKMDRMICDNTGNTYDDQMQSHMPITLYECVQSKKCTFLFTGNTHIKQTYIQIPSIHGEHGACCVVCAEKYYSDKKSEWIVKNGVAFCDYGDENMKKLAQSDPTFQLTIQINPKYLVDHIDNIVKFVQEKGFEYFLEKIDTIYEIQKARGGFFFIRDYEKMPIEPVEPYPSIIKTIHKNYNNFGMSVVYLPKDINKYYNDKSLDYQTCCVFTKKV